MSTIEKNKNHELKNSPPELSKLSEKRNKKQQVLPVNCSDWIRRLLS